VAFRKAIATVTQRFAERTIASTPAFSASGKFVQAQITSTRSFGKVWDKLLGDGL